MEHIENIYKLFLTCSSITTDTRDCPPNSMFFALKGANFNGNAFAQQAINKGCSYAIIDEAQYKTSDRFIVVDNVLKTLQQLALFHRQQLNTLIVGITGTNGKTTTKELLATVLAKKYNVLYTQGNLNNDIGVPKTLLRLTKEHQVAVVEMGASHPLDIKTLVDIVEPNWALITNVGRAHLEGFGSFEGVKKTKAELYDFMAQAHRQQNIFVNVESNDLVEMYHKHCGGDNYISYSPNNTLSANFCAKITANNPFICFEWRKQNSNKWNNVSTNLIGSYNIANMLAAVSVGCTLGVSDNDICDALEQYVPSNNRSQLIKSNSNTIIMDAYNANPTSMAAALDNFNKIDAKNKMVILGGMKELGQVSPQEHQKIISLLQKYNFDITWLVGEEFKQTQNSFTVFDNVEQVIEKIKTQPINNYTILIKGSNGIHLSNLGDKL